MTTSEIKRLEAIKARAAGQGLEVHQASDPAPGWAVSNWFMSRHFVSLSQLESWLHNRKGGQ
jgi:hypothetical protein